MGSTEAGRFSCDGCGKTYAWKAEIAGKRVKCKCGQALTVPSEDPALAEAPPEGFEDLYALAEGPAVQPVTPPTFTRSVQAEADGDAPAPKRSKSKASKSNGGGGGGGGVGYAAPALAGSGGGGALAGYAQMAGKRRLADEKVDRSEVFFNPVKDIYIPGGLIVAGTVLSYLALVYNHGIRNPGVAMLAVGVMTLVNVILTIPGILVTIKLFDLGIGPIGPGIVKLAACAIAPGAIGELLGMVFGNGAIGGYIGWFISFGLEVLIFMKLLDMDFFETIVCSTIIWVIQTWIGYAVMLALLSGLGISGLGGGGLGGLGKAGGGGGRIMLSGEVDQDEEESLDNVRARESDEYTVGVLLSGGVQAKDWIEGNNARTLAGMNRAESVKLINDIYGAGCPEIRVYPKKNKEKKEIVIHLIVSPPHDDQPGAKQVRQKLFENVLKPLAKKLGRTKPRDRGEKYINILLMTSEEEQKEIGNGSFDDKLIVPKKPAKAGGKSEDEDPDADDDSDK